MEDSAKRGRGRPRKFEEGELPELYEEFCDEIIDNGYELAPTRTEFSRWLRRKRNSGTRKTIYNYLYKYYPEEKKEIVGITGDVIASGAMKNKYNVTMAIFALKNWCNWSDHGIIGETDGTEEQQEDGLSKALREEAERMEKNAD